MGSPHCYSIVLGGKFGVGKSSLFRRLRSDVFSEEGCEAGAERYTYKTTIDGEAVEVYLWDTGGLEQYHTVTANYYRSCQAIILVYDVDEEQTLYSLKEWIAQAKDYSMYKNNVMLALWGNKNDGGSIGVPAFMGSVKGFMDLNDISNSLHCTMSAKTGYNVKEAFDGVIAALMSRGNIAKEEPLNFPNISQRSGCRFGLC